MQMDAGLDTGYMLLTRYQSISQTDTTGSLESALAQLGAQALLETLVLLERAQLRGQAQPAEGASYASKVQKEEARLDFSLPAAQLDRVVRAFNPSPVAFTAFRGETLRVWSAEPAQAASAGAPPGSLEVRADGTVAVACATGGLILHDVQRPGGKVQSAAAWAAGMQLKPGERLGV
jgi:methionyl-tRNA formyltransferase